MRYRNGLEHAGLLVVLVVLSAGGIAVAAPHHNKALRGPAGVRGARGPAGEQGMKGLQGPIGLPGPGGSTGPQGEQGIRGPIGATGVQVTAPPVRSDGPGVQVEPGQTGTSTARCPDGYAVGGGGGSIRSSGGELLSADVAEEYGHEKKYVVTAHNPSATVSITVGASVDCVREKVAVEGG